MFSRERSKQFWEYMDGRDTIELIRRGGENYMIRCWGRDQEGGINARSGLRCSALILCANSIEIDGEFLVCNVLSATRGRKLHRFIRDDLPLALRRLFAL